MKPKDPNKVQRIQDATIKVYVKYGFAGITMGRISTFSGLSTGAIYTYFDKKEDILQSIFDRVTKKRREEFPWRVDEGDTTYEIFSRIWDMVHQFETENYDVNRLAKDYFFSDYSTLEKKQAFVQLNMDILEAVEMCIKRGDLIDIHPIAIAKFIVNNVQETVAQQRKTHLAPLLPNANTYKKMVWKAIQSE